MKKNLSLVLSLVMIITTLCALPFTAKADTSIDTVAMEYKLKGGEKKYFNIADDNYTVEDYVWKYRDGTGDLYNTPSTENAFINYNYVLYVELKAKSGYKFNQKPSVTLNGGQVRDLGTINPSRNDAYDELDYMGNQCFTMNNDYSIIWFSVRYYPVGKSYYGTAESSKRPDISYPDFASPGETFYVEHGSLYGDTHFTKWGVAKTNLSNGKQEIIKYDKETEKGIYITAPDDAVRVAAMVYVDNCEYKETVIEPSTCSKKGKSANICTVCGNKEFGTEKELPLDNTKHNFGTGLNAEYEVEWDENNNCTCTGICKDCGKTITEKGTVTSEVEKAPTCTKWGMTKYTAKFMLGFDDETSSIEDIEPLGHDFSDGAKACKNCGKKKNTLKVKAKTVKVKKATVKKKNVAIARKKALTVSKAKGKVTYKKVKGNKKIVINKKTGKITVKKGLKKGTYKVKVKVNAAGNKSYIAGRKTVTVKIIVK